MRRHRLRLGEGPTALREAEHMLDPNVFTIGFARRFATYKRATLIMRDAERLMRLLGSPERPVQIIYAGKAHPADEPGKALIKEVYLASRSAQVLRQDHLPRKLRYEHGATPGIGRRSVAQ